MPRGKGINSYPFRDKVYNPLDNVEYWGRSITKGEDVSPFVKTASGVLGSVLVDPLFHALGGTHEFKEQTREGYGGNQIWPTKVIVKETVPSAVTGTDGTLSVELDVMPKGRGKSNFDKNVDRIVDTALRLNIAPSQVRNPNPSQGYPITAMEVRAAQRRVNKIRAKRGMNNPKRRFRGANPGLNPFNYGVNRQTGVNRFSQNYGRRNNYGGAGKPRSQTQGRVNRSGPGMSTSSRPVGVSGADIKASTMSGEDFRIIKLEQGSQSMTSKIYLGTIGYTTTGTVSWVPSPTLLTNVGGQYYFNPTNASYLPAGIVNSTGTLFDKYKVNGGTMTFIPCISGFSNPDIRVAAFITPNIDHWFRLANAGFVGVPVPATGASTPTRQSLMTNPGACAVPGWVESFTCPIPRSGWRYTACPDSGTGGVFNFTESMASQRQSYAFTMGLSISGTLPASTLTVMEVWMDIIIEFKGQAGFANRDTTFLNERRFTNTLTPDEVSLLRQKFLNVGLESKDHGVVEKKVSKKSSSTKSNTSDRERKRIKDDVKSIVGEKSDDEFVSVRVASDRMDTFNNSYKESTPDVDVVRARMRSFIGDKSNQERLPGEYRQIKSIVDDLDERE